MLNLNACLTKAGIRYDTLWSADFRDEYFLSRLQSWLQGDRVQHDASHVKALGAAAPVSGLPQIVATTSQKELTSSKAILGIFDEAAWGCTTQSFPTNSFIPWEFSRSD